MNPLVSVRNFTPSSTAFPSPESTTDGIVAAGFHRLHGHVDRLAVVKLDVNVAASALPARSFTRGSVAPPTTTIEYVVLGARAAAGVRLTVRVFELYVTVLVTDALLGSWSWIVAVVSVEGSIGSLNVTENGPARETFVAPAGGAVPVTTGGVVSVGNVVVNNTS